MLQYVKKNYRNIAVILAVAIACFMFGGYYNADRAREDANTANSKRIEADIASLHIKLDRISTSVDTSIKGLGRVEERISRSQSAVSESVTRIGTDTERIRQVEQGLQRIDSILQEADRRSKQTDSR